MNKVSAIIVMLLVMLSAVFAADNAEIPKKLTILPPLTAEAKLITGEVKMAKTVVAKGDSIKVDYEGSLKDGTVFDSSKGREPLAFTVGAGQMIKGFDAGVVGMKLNEEKSINIKAAEAYGERDEKMVQTVPKSIFPKDFKFTKGEKVGLSDKSGRPFQAVIKDTTADGVVLDFNHFLAGKDLIFKVKVVSIE